MSFASDGTPATSRWRDVWIAAGSSAVTGMGSFLVMTTLLLTLQEEGHGGLAVSALIIAESLPVVALAAVTGRLADRVDSRLLLLVAGVIQVAACFALSAAGGLALRITLLTLVFCGTAIVQPVRQALLMTMVTREDLPKASGITQTASTAGMIVGPALAGFAQDGLGTPTTLRIAAVAFGATIVAGLLFQTRRGGAVASTADEKQAPARMDGLLRLVTIGFAVVVGAVAANNVVDVFLVKETLGASSSAYGVITSMWTVGMIGGTWVTARLLKGAADDSAIVVRAFVCLAAICTVSAVGAQSPTVAMIIPLWLIGGSLNGAVNVQVFTVFGRRTPAHARGRLSARLNAAVQGAALLGDAGGGLVLQWWTPRQVLTGAGIAGVVAVLALAPWIRATVRRTRAAEKADASPSGADQITEMARILPQDPRHNPDLVGKGVGGQRAGG
ncbi:MAG: MFS transporter [Hamadaea sp.]|nr:MFS transporter [Hamadaea sp.]